MTSPSFTGQAILTAQDTHTTIVKELHDAIMNLGVESESPWGDERSQSPITTSTTANGQDENEPESPAIASSSQSPTTSSPQVKVPGGRSRGPRKFNPQPTTFEAVDDPLGPLGKSSKAVDEDTPPALPQKETVVSPRPSTAASQSSQARPAHTQPSDDYDESRPRTARQPPPVQPPSQDAPKRQTQPGVSVEQAARPTFRISVGDPHKVGDLATSHTVYQVRTKTTSKAYRQPEFEVSRRYRDFLWLYNQLHQNNPGVVVPPPPEKQAVGRFESDFVEARRSALERMLNKTASHLILQHDADLKLFLESDSFTVDIKTRERKDPDMPTESKGLLGGLSIGGSSTKYIEQDDWFLDRRVYFDNMETQLRALEKATEMAIVQRKFLSEAAGDLSAALNSLSLVEISPALTGPLASLSDLQLRIRDLYARQAEQDVLTLGNTIAEYIRLCGSIRKAFEQRQRSWQLWQNAASDLQKRRAALDKLHRQGRTQQDKIGQLQADVADAERRAHQQRLVFEDLGKSMRGELERFEREKVEDFRMGVETFLESSVEAQKELIELWETYLMHFDEDEDEAQAQIKEQAVSAGLDQGMSSSSTTAGVERASREGADDETRRAGMGESQESIATSTTAVEARDGA